jgi:hypothetical protein
MGGLVRERPPNGLSVEPKPQSIRYFVDEDLLALGKLLSQVRDDVTFAGDPGAVRHRRERPPCTLVTRGDKDRDWIPRVADAGWLIITRDSQIQAHRSLLAAVRESHARMVALVGKDARTPWDQLRLLLSHWDAIEKLDGSSGPFIHSITKSTMHIVDLG